MPEETEKKQKRHIGPCEHLTIARCEDPYETHYIDTWVCVGCGLSFHPANEVHDRIVSVENSMADIVGAVTSVFSTTLWDLHQRSLESGQQEVPSPSDLCEEQGHAMMENGKCARCGHSPFLGGDSDG